MKQDIAALKHDLKHDMAALEARLTGMLELLRRDMIIRA
jgi:hypothetical protein